MDTQRPVREGPFLAPAAVFSGEEEQEPALPGCGAVLGLGVGMVAAALGGPDLHLGGGREGASVSGVTRVSWALIQDSGPTPSRVGFQIKPAPASPHVSENSVLGEGPSAQEAALGAGGGPTAQHRAMWEEGLGLGAGRQGTVPQVRQMRQCV